jgi:fido (protein-threonine AMPylation protein)
LKTINNPLIGKCPEWGGEVPLERLAEFKALLDQVHQELLTLASRAIVTQDDPRRWHAILFSPFVPVNYYAGHYRGVDPDRPCLATSVAVGVVAGSDFKVVRAHMTSYVDAIRRQISDLELRWPLLTPDDRVIQLAIVTANLVGVFIRIHPFVNGNGRTSRLLWLWSLLRFGVPPQCCTHPRPDAPYTQLMDAAMRGDNKPLALYVLGHLNLHAPSQN